MKPSFLTSFSKNSNIYTGRFPIILGGAINCVGSSRSTNQRNLLTEDCNCESAGYSSIPSDCVNSSNLIDVTCLDGSVLRCYRKCCMCEDLGYTTNSISVSTGNVCRDILIDEPFDAVCNGVTIPCYRPIDLPFDRTDPDLIIWLKSDYGVTLDGSDRLLSWCDFSSSENDSFNSIYAPNVCKAGEKNGYPYFGSISGGQTLFNIPAANVKNYDPTGNALSILAVFKSSTPNPFNDSSPINIGDPGYYTNRGIGLDDSGNTFGMHYYGGTLDLGPVQLCPDVWYSAIITVGEGGTISSYVNGFSVKTVANTFGHKSGKTIGGGAGDSSFGLAEALAFSRILGMNEIHEYQTYLMNKYGIEFLPQYYQKYFKGFQDCGTYYKTFTFTDWDVPLYGVGIEPDSNVGPFVAPSYRVDGHATFTADGTGQCIVTESTGSVAGVGHFPVGSTWSVAYVESIFAPQNIQSNYYAAFQGYDITYFKAYLENPML